MRRAAIRLGLTTCCLALLTGPAWAHPGHLEGGFHDGFTHPLFGWDHLLAMVAVGLLGVRLGGRALWMLPASFLMAMLAGGLAAEAGMPLPLVEEGIAASVLILGMLVALAGRLPLAAAAALVAAFACFHGYAHAAEMTAGGTLSTYAAGFILSTALLHVLGIAGGLALARLIDAKALRVAGGAITAAGLLIVLGAL